MNAFPIPSNNTWLTTFLVMTLSLPLHAHEDPHAAHNSAKSSFFIGGGVQSLGAEQAWPAPRLPSVLEAGSQREDERGQKVTYLEAGIDLRLPYQHQAMFKIAKHAIDMKPEVEALWIEGKPDLGLPDRLSYRLGRQQVPIGLLNQQEMHAWNQGVAPIAMRAVLNDSWRSDGLVINWQTTQGLKLSGSVWQNDLYPGAPDDRNGINTRSLSVGWQSSSLTLMASHAQIHSSGRALTTIGSARHTHTLPSCETIDENRVCLVGDIEVSNLTFKTRYQALSLHSEVFYKKETGYLDSFYGLPDYQGEFFGGWLDLSYQLAAKWQLTGRLEKGWNRHQFSGQNAQLIAEQTQLTDTDSPLNAYGLAINWRPSEGQFIGLETHQETFGELTNRMWLARYQTTFTTRW